MPKKKTKKKEIIQNDSFIFIMLLATISILAVSLKDYTFSIGGIDIIFSIFVIPFILFISDYITKKYGFKETLYGILVSSLIIVTFLVLIKDLTNQKVIVLELLGYFFSYFISMLINLSIYYYIILNFKSNVILIYINYVFSLIINHLMYLIFLHNMIMTDNFWKSYFVSIIIEMVIFIGLVFIDSKIERGIEKKKIKRKKTEK